MTEIWKFAEGFKVYVEDKILKNRIEKFLKRKEGGIYYKRSIPFAWDYSVTTDELPEIKRILKDYEKEQKLKEKEKSKEKPKSVKPVIKKEIKKQEVKKPVKKSPVIKKEIKKQEVKKPVKSIKKEVKKTPLKELKAKNARNKN